MTGVTLLSVFLVGLFGGVHCASMCGGLVSVMAGSAGRRGAVIAVRAEGLRRPAGLLIGHNLGRLTSYTLAGALAGSLGSSATLVSRVLPLQQLAFVATNLLLIAIGLHLTGALRLVALEPVGAALWGGCSRWPRACCLPALPGRHGRPDWSGAGCPAAWSTAC